MLTTGSGQRSAELLLTRAHMKPAVGMPRPVCHTRSWIGVIVSSFDRV